jgi:hypothetical protein
MEVTGVRKRKDCRSPADNDKDHIKSELLSHVNPIWRQRTPVSLSA